MSTLVRVRCSGCRRTIGYSEQAQLRSATWCDGLCHAQPAVGPNEVRDDLMVELSRLDMADGAIGDLFGVSRSRVQRVVSIRSGGAALDEVYTDTKGKVVDTRKSSN